MNDFEKGIQQGLSQAEGVQHIAQFLFSAEVPTIPPVKPKETAKDEEYERFRKEQEEWEYASMYRNLRYLETVLEQKGMNPELARPRGWYSSVYFQKEQMALSEN